MAEPIRSTRGRRNPKGPLRFSRLIQILDVVWFDRTRPPVIDSRNDDRPYTVKMRDRLDLLAQDELGHHQRGWIIMERNDLRLWPNDLVPGETIMLPTTRGIEERNL